MDIAILPQPSDDSTGTTSRRRNTASERGTALVLVMMFSLVVTAVLTSMIVASNTEHQIAANERDAERSMYVARAGLSYAYKLFQDGTLAGGETFDSDDDSDVAAGLEGGRFTGTMEDISEEAKFGSRYRITSTGTFNRAQRNTEVTIQISPDAFTFGLLAFSEAWVHNHLPGTPRTDPFRTTIFSNDFVEIKDNVNVIGAVVSGGKTNVSANALIEGNIFANEINVHATTQVTGKGTTISAVKSKKSKPYDVTDSKGNGYSWVHQKASKINGTGAFDGGKLDQNNQQTVDNGDEFLYSIFTKGGGVDNNAELNVHKYVSPPLLDYRHMRLEADKFDPTFFTSMAAFMTYLNDHVETLGGGTPYKQITIGTEDEPEYIYVQGDCDIGLLGSDGGAEDVANGKIKADGFHLEGGIYCSGRFRFRGPKYNPAIVPVGYNQLYINATPYCYPAIIAYSEPSGKGSDPLGWTPSDTPPMGPAPNINISSNEDTPTGSVDDPCKPENSIVDPGPPPKCPGALRPDGFVRINGLTLARRQTHIHHDDKNKELITMVGAELAYIIHYCNLLNFTYDPAVTCTQFLFASEGTPEVVSYRETR